MFARALAALLNVSSVRRALTVPTARGLACSRSAVQIGGSAVRRARRVLALAQRPGGPLAIISTSVSRQLWFANSSLETAPMSVIRVIQWICK
eukprot:scaffold50_cov420-Prasinococcus_capsulatus_cf.AAC.22